MKNITVPFILARTNSNFEDIHKIGVYKIYHLHNPSIIYIGSASSCRKWREGFKQRWYIHLKSLKQNKHHSPFLQRVVNKYGIEDLRFEILEFCKKEEILIREQYWLDKLKPFKTKGYNTCELAGNSFGYKMLEEQIKNRKKIYQYDLKGNFIQEWKSLTEAAKVTNTRISEIKDCAKFRVKYTNNFIWRYNFEKVESIFNTKIFEIACYYNGIFKLKGSLNIVEKNTKVNKTFIYKCIHENSFKEKDGWLFRKYDKDNLILNIDTIKTFKTQYEVIDNNNKIVFDKLIDMTNYVKVHRKFFEKKFKIKDTIEYNNLIIKKIKI